jgi:hypothetical protein
MTPASWCLFVLVEVRDQWTRLPVAEIRTERAAYVHNSVKSTCMEHGRLEKLTVAQLVKIFLAFYGTRRYITMFTKARHISSIHTLLPFFSKTQFSIILPSMTRFSKWPLAGFQTKTCHALIITPMPATCPACLILLDLIILLISGDEYKYEAPQYVIFSTVLLLPLLNTSFSNVINLRSSFNVRDSVSHAVWNYIVPKTRRYTESVVIIRSDTLCAVSLFTNRFITQNFVV